MYNFLILFIFYGAGTGAIYFLQIRLLFFWSGSVSWFFFSSCSDSKGPKTCGSSFLALDIYIHMSNIHTILVGTLEPTVRQRRPEGAEPAGEDADLQPAQEDPRRGGPCTPIPRAGTVTPSDCFT